MRILGIAAFVLLVSGAVGAQQTNAPSATGAAGGNAASAATRQPSTTLPGRHKFGTGTHFLSPATVALSDGLPLPERVKIERVCNGSAHLETYTDSKGRFSFVVGHSIEMQDASSRTDNGTNSQFGNRGNAGGPASRMGVSADRELWACEIRAALQGFRSSVISLANMRSMDNPEIGTIILHRLGNVDGLTISVNVRAGARRRPQGLR